MADTKSTRISYNQFIAQVFLHYGHLPTTVESVAAYDNCITYKIMKYIDTLSTLGSDRCLPFSEINQIANYYISSLYALNIYKNETPIRICPQLKLEIKSSIGLVNYELASNLGLALLYPDSKNTESILEELKFNTTIIKPAILKCVYY